MTLAPTSLIRALLCAASMLMAGQALAANPEPMYLDPDILAEIARQRARASTLARAAANAGKEGRGGGPPSAAECGAVAIGNIVGNGRTGFSPIDVNVVIVGDVINANNKCK